MKPAARIQTTIDILTLAEGVKVPLDAVTGDYMRNRRYIGAKDRADIAERLYAVVRARARLTWRIERENVVPSARLLVLTWVMLSEGKSAADIETLFDGQKFSPAPLDDNEKKLVTRLDGGTLDHPDMPDAVRAECPPAYEETLRTLWGGSFAEEMHAMISPATLDLRVNTRLSTRDKVMETLQKDGVACDPAPLSPWGIRVRGKTFISKTKAFVKGWIDIQDEGSQLIALICGAQAGQQVLDYCAGGGGKTLAIAAQMNNKGRIVACDTDKTRLEKARPRFRRAHVHDIIEVRSLSDEKNRKWLRRQKETFDVVLADVPCTGTGTWRRNPDLRWRQFGPSLAELLATQADILDRAAKTVKVGGRLVYATCSLLPEENEHQAEAFLVRHPDFEVLPLAQAWPEGTTAPCAGPYLRLTPRQHNTDGFFAATFVRKKSGPESPVSGQA